MKWLKAIHDFAMILDLQQTTHALATSENPPLDLTSHSTLSLEIIFTTATLILSK
jgi:hypothetical protein